jgi:hypothetical protein
MGRIFGSQGTNVSSNEVVGNGQVERRHDRKSDHVNVIQRDSSVRKDGDEGVNVMSHEW